MAYLLKVKRASWPYFSEKKWKHTHNKQNYLSSPGFVPGRRVMCPPGIREQTMYMGSLDTEVGARKSEFLHLKSTSGRMPPVEFGSFTSDPRAKLCAAILFEFGGGVGGNGWQAAFSWWQRANQRPGFWIKVNFLTAWDLSAGLWGTCCSLFIPAWLLHVALYLYLLDYFPFRWAQASVLLKTPGDMQSMRMMWREIYTGNRSALFQLVCVYLDRKVLLVVDSHRIE